MKKIMALVLSAILLLGLLAGCGSNSTVGGNGDAPATEATGTNGTVTAGSLVVSANASLTLNYNADGVVLSIEGNNQEGDTARSPPDALRSPLQGFLG